MRPLLLAVLLTGSVCLAQNAPADPPYPSPAVDPTKDVKEPEPPEPERKKSAKERKQETRKTKK